MVLYGKTKVKVRSLYGDTDYLDIVAGVLQRDTLAPYLFIICLDYVLRTSIDKMKESGFKLTKERSRRYPAQTITDAGNADDIALLTNAPAQAETLLHSLERTQDGIYVLSWLKLVDKFTYLGSSVSSTETVINTRLAKAWTVNDKLSVI